MPEFLNEIVIEEFQNKIFTWYKSNKRDLPWRKTSDPYAILVSEMMSQQTQLSRVIPKYLEWMQQLPTLESLSTASTDQVLRFWSGLGYNRRAIYLKNISQLVVSDYNGQFPKEYDNLITLPGIGKYTASAISCFAFNQQIVVIDTNVRKTILLTFFPYNEHHLVNDKEISHVANLLLPKRKAKIWNQALMDYAAIQLKGRKVPLKKQPQFIYSSRYYRGMIIKLLLQKKQILRKDIGVEVGYDPKKTNGSIDALIDKLVKEKLIVSKGSYLQLPRY